MGVLIYGYKILLNKIELSNTFCVRYIYLPNQKLQYALFNNINSHISPRHWNTIPKWNTHIDKLRIHLFR